MSTCILIHRGALGDFVLSLPVLSALKAAGCDNHILITRPDHGNLARALGLCEAALDCESGPGYRLLAKDDSAAETFLRKYGRVDLLVALIADNDRSFCQWAEKQLAEKAVAVFPRSLEGSRTHVLQYLEDSLKELRIDLHSPPADYWQGGDRLLIHPGSGGKAKNFDESLFISLHQKLQPSEFLLGPAELESGNRWPGKPVMPESSIALADALVRSKAVISHDSGVAHLAGYLGVPTLALFKTTDPAVWRPLGPRVSILNKPGLLPDDAVTAVEQLFYHSPDPTHGNLHPQSRLR
jgi:heptosyltransferase III